MGRRRQHIAGRHRLSREERALIEGRRSRQRPARRRTRLAPVMLRVIGGLAGVVIVVVVMSQLLNGGRGEVPDSGGPDEGALLQWQEEVESAIRQRALDLGMQQSWVRVHPPGSPEGDSLLTVIEFRVPSDLHLEVLNLELTRVVEEAGGDVVRGVELNDAQVELEVAHEGRSTHRFFLQRYSGYMREAGSLSLIIDDFGTTAQDVLVDFANLDIMWTATVIPGYTYSPSQARYLVSRGIPVLIHMPMEPEAVEGWDLGNGAIYADTSDEEVDRLIGRALDEIAVARGLSNHMGSKATAQPAVMRALMASLRRRGLYFVDSFTTPASVASSEAERAGIPWARRDVFLDSEDDPVVIEQQFRHCLDLAREEGSVIMIGHPRANTLEVLRRWIPRARQAGFRFVTVDQLLRRPGR